MGTPEGVLLRDSSEGERLAWEAREEHVVIWDLALREFRDVADVYVPVPFVVTTKIRSIRLNGESVPLGGENTPTADPLEAPANTADPRKEVDEVEVPLRFRRSVCHSGDDT
jgi:hypothetical protein